MEVASRPKTGGREADADGSREPTELPLLSRSPPVPATTSTPAAKYPASGFPDTADTDVDVHSNHQRALATQVSSKGTTNAADIAEPHVYDSEDEGAAAATRDVPNKIRLRTSDPEERYPAVASGTATESPDNPAFRPEHSLQSQFHGVTWSETQGLWQAKLSPQHTDSLGLYPNEEEAARAYDKAAVRMWGREAQLNFPIAFGSYRRRRGLAAYDSDPEISAESEDGAALGLQDMDEEIVPRAKADERERKRPARRKRPRLVPPHSRSSRYRGVYWEPKGSKWYSSISSNHKQIHLGSFNTEEEAARAFDQEAIRLRGTATYTNFPAEDYVVDDWAHRSERLHAQQKRPQSTSRRRQSKREDSDVEDSDFDQEDKAESDQVEPHLHNAGQPEKDDQAANALLSLGCSLPRRNSKPKQAAPTQKRPTPPHSIEPPLTLRGQKRKRGGLATGAVARTEGNGRARSKYTGVYQQSRGHGWFASICVDKSMRYLGTFASEEEAARAFDQEAIRLRGTGIELNLPHEAEAFMQKLKEEEAASGEPTLRGPAPLVSAGPDFEGHLPRLPVNGQQSGEANDDSSSVPRHARSLERTAAVRSRRIMGRLARSSSLSSSEEEEQEEEGKEEESEVKEEPVASLPVWTGRRPRSIPSKLSKADKPKQSKHMSPGPADTRPSISMPLAQAIDSSLSNYLSLLAPAARGIPSLQGGLGAAAAVVPAASYQGGNSLTASTATGQLARPAASYAKVGAQQTVSPAFAVQHAWQQSPSLQGSFNTSLAFPSGIGLGSVGYPPLPTLAQQPFCQPMLPSFGMPHTAVLPQAGNLLQLGQEGIDLQSLMGGVQRAPLRHLLSSVSGLTADISGLADARRPQPPAALQTRAFNHYPPNASLGVMRPAAMHPAFQSTLAVPPQLNGLNGFQAAPVRPAAPDVAPVTAIISSATNAPSKLPAAGPEFNRKNSRQKPSVPTSFARPDDQAPPIALERRRRSSVNPGIGVN